MMIPGLLRTAIVVILCLACAIPATSQSGGGKIGASNGEIVGVLVGAGAAIAVVVVVIYHQAHKHPTIVGCVSRRADGLSLTNTKDNKIYALSGDSASLKADEQVALKGKKVKDSSGKLMFQVEKLTKDYGACHL